MVKPPILQQRQPQPAHPHEGAEAHGLDDRDPLKRGRDQAQGMAVARMLARHWAGLDVSDATLASIPLSLRDGLRLAITAGGGSDAAAGW